MDVLNEARIQLESVVSEDLLKDYIAILRKWFLFNSTTNRDEFDRQARKLLLNEEQIRAHDKFLRALLEKTSSETSVARNNSDNSKCSKNGKSSKSKTSSYNFQPVSYNEYVKPAFYYEGVTNRFAVDEHFMPDPGFISVRVNIVAWENGLQGAEEDVSNLMAKCCKNFMRNILTAMITRKKGFKVRDSKFQYGFNLPIPNPFLRNFSNVKDSEAQIEADEYVDGFPLKPRPSSERMEFQSVFAYSSSKQNKSDNLLSVKLLYDTLKENPDILGKDAGYELKLLKLNLLLET